MFRLTLATGNDAFGEQGSYAWRAEVARILRRTAHSIEDGADAGTLADISGNTVGSFAALGEEDTDLRLIERCRDFLDSILPDTEDERVQELLDACNGHLLP